MLKIGDKVRLNKRCSEWVKDFGLRCGDIGVVFEFVCESSIGVKFNSRKGYVYQTIEQLDLVYTLDSLLKGYNLSRLSMALGKHRSYLNKMIQQGVSGELYERIKSKITIDWTSEKPLHVNDGKHVPYTVKPVNCVLPKHKEWLQELMMNGCIKL